MCSVADSLIGKFAAIFVAPSANVFPFNPRHRRQGQPPSATCMLFEMAMLSTVDSRHRAPRPADGCRAVFKESRQLGEAIFC